MKQLTNTEMRRKRKVTPVSSLNIVCEGCNERMARNFKDKKALCEVCNPSKPPQFRGRTSNKWRRI